MERINIVKYSTPPEKYFMFHSFEIIIVLKKPIEPFLNKILQKLVFLHFFFKFVKTIQHTFDFCIYLNFLYQNCCTIKCIKTIYTIKKCINKYYTISINNNQQTNVTIMS